MVGVVPTASYWSQTGGQIRDNICNYFVFCV